MAPLASTNHAPAQDEFAPYYEGYVNLVRDSNIIDKLVQQGQQIYALIQQLNQEQATFRYATNKWSVKEVLGHLIDTERVMSYRALCIARGEKAPLPGFNQDDYVTQANFDERSMQSFSSEYDTQRHSTISLFNSFTDEQLLRKGTANNATVSVRALIYIIAGHEKHHLNILEEKYNLTV